MIGDELLRDAEDQLKAFAGATTVCEAEVHYRTLRESLIPELYADNPMLGAAIDSKFQGAILQRIARAGGTRERPAALLSSFRGAGRREERGDPGRGGPLHRRRESLGPLP